jgi:maltose 6'-phosphate phosphatase
MKAIQLLCAKNIIVRHDGIAHQHLAFSMAVQHLAVEKLVEVYWAGEDGVWHILPAEYRSSIGQQREIWCAEAFFNLAIEDSPLPGDIQFSLHYRAGGQDYWDNNGWHNYAINADSGARIGDDFPVLHIDFQHTLRPGQQYYPITVAVRHALHPKEVYVRWTTDHWRQTQTSACFFRRKHWDKLLGSNARNPNRYDCGIWISHLNVGDAFRLEYAIGCETGSGTLWDNNFAANYLARRERLKVLTLNLHCYQEENQITKFTQIARAINDLNVDIVCLQEVGELWNSGNGDWHSNAARIIKDQLTQPYHYQGAWSHLGFHKYREGIAILSKYPFLSQDSGYVSPIQDVNNINSRRVVMAQVDVPYLGLVNVFSVHLSWWNSGFREQLENLMGWAEQRHSGPVVATFLCGDFNNAVGSEGYWLAAERYEDQFLKANASGLVTNHDQRIDYIFMKKGNHLQAVSARMLFTESDYGRVSDHPGVYAEFEPA